MPARTDRSSTDELPGHCPDASGQLPNRYQNDSPLLWDYLSDRCGDASPDTTPDIARIPTWTSRGVLRLFPTHSRIIAPTMVWTFYDVR
jgi:hypothetical protein